MLLIITTTILMFLAFGSLVLPIKAALMSALTLGSTMGVLTWMFVDGHGSGLMNYTPQPLMAPMIGLIIAVIWGLSTDYEVFLVSRMVEARERGMSTAEAIRIGTATTGRLITGAALILAVVAGAFVFSDLVMMKYLAFGLLIALLLDATVVRMFLVPAIMKLLGDDCWWAPKWMKRLQDRLGLGETELPDERKRPDSAEPGAREALVGAGAPLPHAAAAAARHPTHPAVRGFRPPRPGAATTRTQAAPPRANGPSVAGTTRMREQPGRPQEPHTPGIPLPRSSKTQPKRLDLAVLSHSGGGAARLVRAAPRVSLETACVLDLAEHRVVGGFRPGGGCSASGWFLRLHRAVAAGAAAFGSAAAPACRVSPRMPGSASATRAAAPGRGPAPSPPSIFSSPGPRTVGR